MSDMKRAEVKKTEEDEICVFAINNRLSTCKILVGEKCDGTDRQCKFYKTESQFRKDRDRNILTNRIKGNCGQCRYMGTPCRLSTEEENK